MNKPYKYDEWLKSHVNNKGEVEVVSILTQYANTVSNLQVDNSHSIKGVINNASLYVQYYINELQQPNG